jgi:hypothetical protein
MSDFAENIGWESGNFFRLGKLGRAGEPSGP